jgi:hypothetical protein
MHIQVFSNVLRGGMLPVSGWLDAGCRTCLLFCASTEHLNKSRMKQIL